MELILSKIHTISDLSKYLRIDRKELIKYSSEDYQSQSISVIHINKYERKFREVAVVRDPMYKLALKALAGYLDTIYKAPPCVYGYVKKRGIKKNAARHLAKKIILKTDIKDFFYSITTTDMYNLFINLSARDEIADLLSKIVTYRGVLFPGLNTSPVLSNIHCIDMDEEFQELSRKYISDYTRYADDIAFSSMSDTPKKEEIIEILKKKGFSINDKKYKIMKRGRFQVVTGLSVFDETQPRIPRNIKKRIRLACYLLAKHGDEDEYDENVKWCSSRYLKEASIYYKMIEPSFYEKMRNISKGMIEK